MAAEETVAGAKVAFVTVERYGAESKLHLVGVICRNTHHPIIPGII
jgi:hypothetical protein